MSKEINVLLGPKTTELWERIQAATGLNDLKVVRLALSALSVMLEAKSNGDLIAIFPGGKVSIENGRIIECPPGELICPFEMPPGPTEIEIMLRQLRP